MRHLVLSVLSVLLVCATFGRALADVVLEAMQDELSRTMAELHFDSIPGPYYAQYRIWDTEHHTMEASFGAIVQSRREHSRSMDMDVRVGSYAFDSGDFFSITGMRSGRMGAGRSNMVLDNDYDAIRRDLWLATDAAYKTAIENLAAKRAALSNQRSEERMDDFLRVEPVTFSAPMQALELDASAWERALKDASAVFRKYPTITSSSVKLDAYVETTRFVNSEGSTYRTVVPVVHLRVVAAGVTEDGHVQKNFASRVVRLARALGDRKDVVRLATDVAEELMLVLAAPALDDNYEGPVILSGEASAQFLSGVFSSALSGSRPPDSDNLQLSQAINQTSPFASRLGKSVLADFLSVRVDPAATEFNGTPLVGSMQVDIQGVRAEPLQIIRDGTLETLLTTRRPRKELATANGHARLRMMGLTATSPSNTFVEASDMRSFDALREQLRELCREEDLPYGIIVSRFDDMLITGIDMTSLMAGGLGGMMGDGGAMALEPLIVHRVWANDGRVEMLSGLKGRAFNPRNLRDIVAAGGTSAVYNTLSDGSVSEILGPMASMNPMLAAGGTLVPASIVAPSLLMEEMDFRKAERPEKGYVLSHPFFEEDR